MSNSPVSVPTTPTAGAKALQERLNYLISRLSASIGVIKTWPSTDGDDASIHVKTTSKLISTILETKRALEKVEGTIKADAELRKSLQNCPVPINLLDLLDHGDGLNPDCFSRGLLREALGQLAGLKRRKLALEMLGAAVQTGLNRRLAETKAKTVLKTQEEESVNSNKRPQTNDDEVQDAIADEPVAKRARMEP